MQVMRDGKTLRLLVDLIAAATKLVKMDKERIGVYVKVVRDLLDELSTV